MATLVNVIATVTKVVRVTNPTLLARTPSMVFVYFKISLSLMQLMAPKTGVAPSAWIGDAFAVVCAVGAAACL